MMRGRSDARRLQIRGDLERAYGDVYTPGARAALDALAPLNEPRRALMSAIGTPSR